MEAINGIADKIQNLRKLIDHHQQMYYRGTPELSDREFDNLYDQLLLLEDRYPEYRDPNSPTARIGSDLDTSLEEKPHQIPVLSLDKCYSENELHTYLNRTYQKLGRDYEIVMEQKIDGISLVLYYRNGRLDLALTRGNGLVGNDVTANVRTVRDIPLMIAWPDPICVRGELHITRQDFQLIRDRQPEMEYANPRNLAAGVIRRKNSKETAQYPLRFFAYEAVTPRIQALPEHKEDRSGTSPLPNSPIEPHHSIPSHSPNSPSDSGQPESLPFQEIMTTDNPTVPPDNLPSSGNSLPSSHYRTLQMIAQLGFSVNPATRLMHFQDQAEISRYLKNARETRSDLPYEIDGLVIKVDNPEFRERLGYTGHHPRWAIAYKFEAPMASTRVDQIIFQVGRGGRITPVAILDPVELSGSTVSRATLHNEDYMSSLEIGIGDWVTVSKRGDVIPAIEEVVEKNQDRYQLSQFPKECPSCRTALIKDGAHHYCPSADCPGKKLGSIIFFAGKGMMDIQNLGEKTLEFCFEKGFIRAIPDLYRFDFSKLNDYPGYGEKKIALIQSSIEKSKQKPFPVVLSAMGFRDIGPKVVELLIEAGYTSLDSLIELASADRIESLTEIQGIGEKTARQIIRFLTDPESIGILRQLESFGLKMAEEKPAESAPAAPQIFKDEIWVITGSFQHFQPRDKAAAIIKKGGGKIASSVSSRTSYLLLGENPGSKYDQALKLAIPIMTEEEFLQRINDQDFQPDDSNSHP
ncbi:MAG: NAD-dependent DNA ligase LigA [Candidatus Delongbacteria bacterium]|nr:NAD-dependent DNA ligase LigA [Candidatus Delongbacteria bacterium]